MAEKFDIHGHDVVFRKNEGKAVIELDLGQEKDTCYLIDIFSVDDTDYVALLSNESTQVYIFYYNESFDNDDINLELIDDEDEFEEVYHIFTHYWDEDSLDSVLDQYEDDLDEFIMGDDDIIDEE